MACSPESISGAAEIWLAVAYLSAMFVVLAFRPQQIGNPVLFRMSYILFAFYLIVPSCVNTIASLTFVPGLVGNRDSETFFGLRLPHMLAKILLGLSIVFALSSLMRRRVMDDWDRRSDREEPA